MPCHSVALHSHGTAVLRETLYATQPKGISTISTDQLMTDSQTVLACNMTAISPQDRKSHTDSIRKLFQSVTDITEVPDGYAFHLPTGNEVLFTAAEFIAKETLCCPFFRFELHIEPAGSAQRLHLTGPSGVKPFIQAEIGSALSPAVAKKAGFQTFK